MGFYTVPFGIRVIYSYSLLFILTFSTCSSPQSLWPPPESQRTAGRFWGPWPWRSAWRGPWTCLGPILAPWCLCCGTPLLTSWLLHSEILISAQAMRHKRTTLQKTSSQKKKRTVWVGLTNAFLTEKTCQNLLWARKKKKTKNIPWMLV